MKRLFQSTLLAACTVLLAANAGLQAQTVPVGSGSYTKTFPGVDAAGRNGYPSGTPFTTGQAAQRPVPTNDWWSNKLKNPHSDNLFTYPFTLKTKNSGLVVTYIPWGPIDNIEPVVVGVSGLNAPQARVADYSDWTVTMDWTAGTKQFGATAGLGMPFLHFTKGSSDVATVQVNQGTATVANEVLRIENARNGADFAVYAPVGSVWVQSGNTYTSTLNGKNYWSLAFLPLTAPSVAAAAAQFAPYAYVVPVNTRAEWSYNAATSVVTTQFTADVAVKEGLDSVLLMGLLPHQWSSLAPGSAAPSGPTYPTVRGTLKCLAANAFTVQDTFHGILPTLPYVDPYSAGFQPLELSSKIQLLQNDPLATWTDSYNEGQEMNRLIQTARAAELTQDTAAFGLLFQTVKERLEDWLHYQSGEVAFLFYYNSTWSALLGYPAGHGQDLNLNDHHFHWGYFIHAASFVEQFEPGWAASWGPMINLLVRDAASPRRNDALFPYLRSFSPYAGHSWANGFATFPQGNDQESTSESMQFNSSLIHWGSVTGNDSIRNLGIYLYVTEQRAVEEYWFDQRQRNFGPTQPHALVSRVWGNSYDNGTFWTGDIAASFGIELYPIHGGSLYLGHDTLYAHQLWLEMEQKTGILSNAPNVNLWHDIYWQYLSFTNPQKALNLYNSYPGRSLKFGVSDAFTYHWLHAMNALGRVAKGIRANHPLAAAFIRAGDTTYVAQNYGATPKTVLFSTGYALTVPPRTLATSKDIALKGALTTSFPAAYPGGTVTVSAQVTGGTPTQVVFFCGDTAFAAVAQAPFTAVSPPLPSGKHAFYARVYSGASFALTNVAGVLVGDQIPFNGTPIALPGTFPAGHYDAFSGGNASGVCYQDGTRANLGDFRPDEYVDAKTQAAEGPYVGWTANGEWLEFTVDAAQAGLYQMQLRYASGNAQGGGPLQLFSDGVPITSVFTLSGTGNWSTWGTKTLAGVPLKSGVQVLRIAFLGGELNLGKLTWTYTGPLPYTLPVADAGSNAVAVLPATTAALNGSASTAGSNGPIAVLWTQVYGPSTAVFANNAALQTSVSNLQAGIYLVRLTVADSLHADADEVYVIVGSSPNVPPTVSLSSPQPGQTFLEGDSVRVRASVSDLNDSVVRVDFYANGLRWASRSSGPWEATWHPGLGQHVLRAVAFDAWGDSSVSAARNTRVDPAPKCVGTSWNGDFKYRFSDADNNPTLTFIPTQAGTGSPTCILYYGTDPGSMPGYPVQPNVPYTLQASKGTLLYFYYTYSYLGGTERNTSGNKNTYVVGSCTNLGWTEADGTKIQLRPNPAHDWLQVEGLTEPTRMRSTNALGQSKEWTVEPNTPIFVGDWPSGVYFLEVFEGSFPQVFTFVCVP